MVSKRMERVGVEAAIALIFSPSICNEAMMMDDRFSGVELKDIMDLRKDTKGAYTRFCEDILPGANTHRKRDWLMRTASVKVSTVSNTVEEAWALLELSNNWLVWLEIANWKKENPDKQEKEMGKTTNQPKWTNDAKQNDTVEGWRKEGHSEFLRLHNLVREDRASDHGERFEAEFAKKQHAEWEAVRMGRNKRKTREAEEAAPVDSGQVDLLSELIVGQTADI